MKEAPPPAHSEEPFAVWPPLMPSAIDLDMVPLGRWAEYEETYLGTVTIKERVALVAKGAEGNTLETTTETAGGNKTVFATVFTRRPRRRRRRPGDQQRLSGGGRRPDAGAAVAPGQAPYPRARRRASWSASTRSARAPGRSAPGTTATGPPYGEQVDFWIDDSVGPLGLIKLEAEQKQHPTIRAGFKFELVATGGGAIPQITRPALPFDASVLKKRGLPWTRETRVGPQPPAKVVQ